YSALKQNQKAEQNARKALELDNTMYQPYRILSDIYFAKGYEKYENYLQLEEQAKTAYGQQADELVDKRDLAKAAAHDLFLQSDSFLNEALARTDNLSEEKYIKSRKQTLEQLLNATKKDFF
ncbi:MAG: hypothetical protein JW784_07020, partial [Candidatus Cloacimonetes bacterium]|nr:hypothetical protein [Candidatus Cloacimonadota bacterium]